MSKKRQAEAMAETDKQLEARLESAQSRANTQRSRQISSVTAGNAIAKAMAPSPEVRLTQSGRRHRGPDKHRSAAALSAAGASALEAMQEPGFAWPLFIHGEAGSGKTCLGLVMFDWFGGFFYGAAEFCEDLIAANAGTLRYSSGYERTTQEIWTDWRDANFAVLDELGTRERVSDFQYETVKRCIDDRHDKPGVFISNLGLEQIARIYDDRVASRLSEGTVLQLDGDRRLQR